MWKISMSYLPEGWGYDFSEEGTNLRQLPWLPWGGDSSPSPCRGEQCGRLSCQPSISFLYGRQSAGCCSRGQDRVSAFSELKKKKNDAETICIKKCYKKEYGMTDYLKETSTFDRQSGNRTLQARRCINKDEQTEIVGQDSESHVHVWANDVYSGLQKETLWLCGTGIGEERS